MKHTIALVLTLIAASALSAAAADAKALWDKDCAKCHSADGSGKAKMGEKLGVKDYTSAKVQAEMKDPEMAKAIKEGVKKDGKSLMKGFTDYTDDEIKSLVAYIRKMKK